MLKATVKTTLLIKITNTGSGAINFDDFRVHPLDADMTSNVYNSKTGWVIATLDGNNFGTRYSYDSAGRLIATEKETIQGLKKVSENT